MKKKLFITVSVAVVLSVSAALVTSYIDSARVRNSAEPKCTVKIVSDDGNKVTYWGLGYKVIRYPSVSPYEPYKNHSGAKFGSWFMKYEKPTETGNKLFDINEENYYSSEALKFVTEKERYSRRDSKICFSITNISDRENSIAGDSTCFELQMFSDGEWKRVGTKTDHYWYTLGQILKPNETVEREIDLENYFNLPLEKGEYRISVEYLISNTFEIY